MATRVGTEEWKRARIIELIGDIRADFGNGSGTLSEVAEYIFDVFETNA